MLVTVVMIWLVGWIGLLTATIVVNRFGPLGLWEVAAMWGGFFLVVLVLLTRAGRKAEERDRARRANPKELQG